MTVVVVVPTIEPSQTLAQSLAVACMMFSQLFYYL